MQSLQDILKLCQDEDGKVFILDHKGDLQLVILGAKHYQKLKGGVVTIAEDDTVDAEVINKQITQVQLNDEVEGASPRRLAQPTAMTAGGPVSVKSVLQNWHKVPKAEFQEVIDPSWDEDGLGFSV